MKNQKLLLGGLILVVGAIAYCSSPEQKVLNKKEDVLEANDELDKANAEYQEEIIAFRKENADKFAANERSIADFKARISAQKKEAKSDYTKKINDLENKNSDFKKRLDDYKESNKEKWEEFKIEFNSDMNELNKALNDFTTNNK